MHWKKQLRALERLKEWDFAINLMEDVIAKNPNNMDAYIYMNFLLMNLLVEEDYDNNKHDYYVQLAKKYFDESYTKFSGNAEYLFFTGITAAMSEWYFGIETEDWKNMLEKSMQLEPDNILYKRTHYLSLNLKNVHQRKEACDYSKIVLDKNSPIKAILLQKGAIGDYLLRLMTYRAQKTLNSQQKNRNKND